MAEHGGKARQSLNFGSEVARDLARLLDLFSQAEARIEREMLLALARGAEATAAYRRGRLLAVLAVLEELVEKALAGNRDEPGAGPAWDLVRASYREGSETALRALERAGRRDLEGGYAGIHQEAAEALFAALAGSLADAARYVGRRAEDVFRRVTLEETLQQQIAGRTRRETSRAMVEEFERRGVRAFRDKRGAEWGLRTYAEMAARTTAREAHTQGTVRRLAENGIDLVKISEHAHERDVCTRHEGKVYSISGTSGRYPPATGNLPPYHPNCRHVATPYLEEFA